jgi:hypothetical protein
MYLDFSIAYEHRRHGFGHPPDMVRAHSASMKGEYRFHVHVRRFAMKDLPMDEQGLSDWVCKVWKEKDEYLQGMKETWERQRQRLGWKNAIVESNVPQGARTEPFPNFFQACFS